MTAPGGGRTPFLPALAPPASVPPPPTLGRLRSNSEGQLHESPLDERFTFAGDGEVGADVPPVPQLGRQRSNSIGPAQTSHEWAGGARALPHKASTGGGTTPRAARFETLDWEDSGGGHAAGANGVAENECIRVAVRFRPLSDNERAEGGESRLCVNYGDEGQSCTISVNTSTGKKDVAFFYNNVFQPEVTQSDVYRTVGQPIVEGVINGFNGAILAYGQTGSGKTHTMLGPQGAQAFRNDDDVDLEQLGIIPRALQELVDYSVSSEGNVQLRASYVEIYMEHIIDLLSPCPGGAVMRQSGGPSDQSLYLPEVTQTPIESVREALAVMRSGNKTRHVAETKMNRCSSRSHAVFVVTVTNATDKAKQRFAQLYLVDLAGSERVGKTGVEGKQLDEAKDINKSLLALGQVIWALAHKQKHVPYRDSKLTLMLRNCLGGNARTSIMIAASPHETNAQESLSALRFGARASRVQNSARMNVAEDPKELKRLLERAKADLKELRIHCRRLQAEVAAFSTIESYAGDLPCTGARRSKSNRGLAQPKLHRETSSTPLQALTAKRLLVWGLLPSLVCPLSRAVMWDPVIGSDGWTYERAALEKHFKSAPRSLPLSPVTGQRMTSRHMVPNLVVKQLVTHHLPDLHPPEVQLPMIALLHVWHVQMILGYLDARSLARCEAAMPSFLAAADASQAWATLVRLDYPSASLQSSHEPQADVVVESAATDGVDADEDQTAETADCTASSTAVGPRGRYRELRLAGKPASMPKGPQPKSKGLKLFMPPRAPKTEGGS